MIPTKRSGERETFRIVLHILRLNLYVVHSSQALALAEPLFFLLVDLLNPSLRPGLEIPEDFLESWLQTTRNVEKTHQHIFCNIHAIDRDHIQTWDCLLSPQRQANCSSKAGRIHLFDPFGEAYSQKRLSLAKRLPFTGCKLTVLKP